MNDLLWYMTEAVWWSESGESNGGYWGDGNDEYTALYG